jgi:hypothetical protein
MGQLNQFRNLEIDWEMTPETAVTLYLEWGNNDWTGRHLPVRSKADYSNYFVINTWGDEPVVYLIRRNSEEAEELAMLHLPKGLEERFREQVGGLKGVFEPTDEIKVWLKSQLEN